MPNTLPRSGHAPGDVREWFVDAIVGDLLDEEATENGVTLDWLIGRLWDCTDVCPGWISFEYDLPHGSYARVVRALRRDLRVARALRRERAHS